MKAPRVIPAKQMVGVIASHLATLGFTLVYKSPSGSRYLRLMPEPFTIRISDHRVANEFYRREHPQVVRSVALRPAPAPETYLLAVEMAVRYLAACEVRRIQARRSAGVAA